MAFQSCYILESELAAYGLPASGCQVDIMNLVQFASAVIDEACGRLDGDGSGSFAYTTYSQRLLLGTRNRNLIMLPMKPIVAVPASTVSALQALGASGSNYYDTGIVANTLLQPTGQLSGIVAASGRYGYTRQDMSTSYPDQWAMVNPLNLVTIFGGPAPWVAIDVTNIDYDPKTGEVWVPAGLQLQRYSEVLFTYNSGYDPRNMHRIIKHVTASLVKNAMAKGDATTALMSLSLGRSGVNATFYQQLLDPTLEQMLVPFKAVRAY